MRQNFVIKQNKKMPLTRGAPFRGAPGGDWPSIAYRSYATGNELQAAGRVTVNELSANRAKLPR